MANEMVWSVNKGVLTNTKLNLIYRRAAQPMMKFRQFVGFKEAFGKNAGESVNWNKVSNISDYGGKLIETNTMHETTQPMRWGTVTVEEYGNSVPFTFKDETLSQFDINEILRTGLLDDTAKVIDGLIEIQFASTCLKVVGTATNHFNLTTNGTHTGTNTSASLTAYHVRKAVLALKQRNVPGYSGLGGAYVGVINVSHAEQIEGDLVDNKSIGTGPGFQPVLLNGEVGTLSGMRMVEDSFGTQFVYDPDARTALSKASNASGARTAGAFTQAAIHSANASGADAYFFGSPTVREAVAIPEEIRKKIPTDYGRSKGVAWYAILGHKIEYGYAAANEADARIIHWSSE